MRDKVLKIYKQILKSSKQTFGEDKETLNRVSMNIRAKFKDNKNETDEAKILENIKVAEETDHFIRNNIVQGTFENEKSTLKLKLPKDLPANSVIEPINKIRIK